MAIGVGGTSNVVVYATTGEYITGLISATGTITGNALLSTSFVQTPYQVVAPRGIVYQGTGALTSITTAVAAGTSPQGVAVDPSGRFVYVSNRSSATVSMYSIDQSTGALTSITTAVAAGSNPSGVACDPSGRFVYVSNDSTVSMYSINQSTGALTSITTAVASGSGPGGAAIDPTGRFVYVTNLGTTTVSMYSINNFSAGAGTFAGNVLTSGLISATGNITGGNILGGANVNATTHTGTTVSVSGNITGGNVLGGANVNATHIQVLLFR